MNAQLPASVANLTNPTKYLSCAETAKLIRQALKEAFPEVKFYVRSHTYSMGASIKVSWIDGPIADQVNPIVKTFAGASFDGMQDLKTYNKHVLNGEPVHFGADYVFTRRELSPEKVAAMVALVEKAGEDNWLTLACRFGLPWPSRTASQARSAEDFARSLLHGALPEAFEGRKSALVNSISNITADD